MALLDVCALIASKQFDAEGCTSPPPPCDLAVAAGNISLRVPNSVFAPSSILSNYVLWCLCVYAPFVL